ncbi:MAG: thiamine-phosphate kinase [Rhodobiaceae bacterium]|nr:thiamine-phosphate kinase [Rhodobiaceae bacterium]MCC0013020.1 thiamine-phosphate kinase [Rhodobiaceae bacterium]MCC0052024.1 thiamine-phosphate kinase [Rhodobiaceae bacterium]MCC0061633.1 thiamine-phosphate kinase [Rhodobiaceae bacterium]
MFDEDRFIRECLRPLASVPGAAGFTDDAALIQPPEGKSLIATADTIIAGVHFPASERANLIAARAIRVNVSDLVAKGAEPFGYLLHLSVPAATRDEFGNEFAAALQSAHETYGLRLFGGDTTVVPEGAPLSVSVTMLGIAPDGGPVRRSGAKPGDVIFVSGEIGDAALGLLVARGDPMPKLAPEHRSHLEASYRLPRPPVGIQPAIVAHAHASMDISDGLVGDLERMCQASGVSARVSASKVPLSDAVREACERDARLMKVVLTGGDDYQVLVAVPLDKSIAFAREALTHGHTVKAIGTCGDGPPEVVAVDGAGQPLSFTHTRYTHRG